MSKFYENDISDENENVPIQNPSEQSDIHANIKHGINVHTDASN